MRYQEVVNNLTNKNYNWRKFDINSKQIQNIISFNRSEGVNIKEVYCTDNIDALNRNNLALICRAETTEFDPDYEEITTDVPTYILIFIVDYKENVKIKEESFYKISQYDLDQYNRDNYRYNRFNSNKISLRSLFFKAKEKEMNIDTLLDGFLGNKE